MPEKETVQRAKKDLRQGKSASTAAGEFVREEIHHIREGKHGARSTKQAIAIGLSKARRAGVPLSPPKKGSAKTRRAAQRDRDTGRGKGAHPTSTTRSRASRKALARQPHAAASHSALSKQAHRAASQRTHADRVAAAKKGWATRRRREKH